MKSKWKLFFPCYFAFFVNGAMVLLVGAILPYLIEEAGISYSVAGGLLSDQLFFCNKTYSINGNLSNAKKRNAPHRTFRLNQTILFSYIQGAIILHPQQSRCQQDQQDPLLLLPHLDRLQ